MWVDWEHGRWPVQALPDAHISETIFLDGSGIP
jgi:hypothetical protein